jgi:diguanylate cyclase (GGDEF)-like protein
MHSNFFEPFVGLLARGKVLCFSAQRRMSSLSPAVSDAIIISFLSALVFIGEFQYRWAPMLFSFALEYEEWEVDNIIFVIFVMSIGSAVFSFRRVKELATEIRARRSAETEAKKLSRHDPLTGLPNRRYFAEILGDAVLAATTSSQTALLLLDLDGFKTVNDAYGHAVGDQTLVVFSQRLSALMRAGAFAVRIGGDEFAVILTDVASIDDPAALARRIVACVADPFVIGPISTSIGVGVGIAVAPSDGLDPELLVQRADRALYRAKAEGRSCIRFFEPEMDTHVERRMALENELRMAVAKKSIVPYYQPVVAFAGKRIIGFEALARWKSDKFGWVGPDLFITLAEEIGIISDLSDQLFYQACIDAQSWPAKLTLAFNISAVQLRDPTFGLRVLAILAKTGLNPRRLELEITETALVDNLTVARAVTEQLREVGVRIALDDFGTGYATLSQLLSLKLDRIKIDRSFVDRLGKDKQSDTIVRAVLGLASGFDLETTAEGVETAEQMAALIADGCLEGQGYLFGKAMPAGEVTVMLSEQNSDRRLIS